MKLRISIIFEVELGSYSESDGIEMLEDNNSNSKIEKKEYNGRKNNLWPRFRLWVVNYQNHQRTLS